MDHAHDVPLRPANLAAPAPAFPWPAPFGSALFLSVDVDAEAAWTSKDPGHAARLVTMSYGGFEARVGTPKLLEALEDLVFDLLQVHDHRGRDDGERDREGGEAPKDPGRKRAHRDLHGILVA